MNKIYKILGKRGRITIPYEIRMNVGFRYNDVMSFEQKDDNTVIVKRERICDNCCESSHTRVEKNTDEITLLEFIDSLSLAEQRAALVHLSCKWAELQKGGNNDR